MRQLPGFLKRLRIGNVVSSIAVAAALITAAPGAQAADLQVNTDDGPLKGLLVGNIVEFRGIPYARPPVGRLRWMPPEKPTPWNYVRQAKEFGPECLQVTTLGPFAGPANANEDCLYLNVYSPDVDAAKHEKLPVIVWLHGGGNYDGGGDQYDGSKLASQGHTVVVTINYRLGLLGFLANPALDVEGHPFGNYGLLDQQAALRWVKRNIGHFGGDKNNVTVGGQSAGSVDSEAAVLSPLAAGLLDRAIFQSIILEPASLPVAEAKGSAFAVAAGCGSAASAATAKCLRALSAQQIFDLSGTASATSPYVGNLIADGQILPTGTFVAAIAAGKFNHVPIMSGQVEDEENFFLGITEYFETPRKPVSKEDYQTRINAFNAASYPPGTAAKATSLYSLNGFATPQLALDAIGTDSFACAQRHTNILFAAQVPVYMYEFDDRTAPSYFPALPGFQALAYHTSDIQYLFPGWHGGNLGIPHPLNAKQEQLSDKLVSLWTNFARTGNPNGQGNGPWPRYTGDRSPNRASILSEDIPTLSTFTDNQYAAAHKCSFWDKIQTY